MTNFADIMDSMTAKLGALFPLHHRIPNPYDLAQNNGRLLEKGWGIAIAPGGTNPGRFVCSKRSVQATVQIAITRRFYAMEHDAIAKTDCDKLLMTDFELIHDSIHLENLGVPGTLVIGQGFFGIQNVRTDKDLYRSLICNLTVEYFRQ